MRTALGDDAREPRYIETLPGRGYRFVASVGRPARRRRLAMIAIAATLLVVLGVTLIGGRSEPASPVRIARLTERGALVEQLPLPHLALRDLVPSPDGRRLAFSAGRQRTGDIWVFDRTSRVLTRLSEGGDNCEVVWSSDGQWVTWASWRNDSFDLVRRRADGSTAVELLLSAPGDQYPEGWSADGTSLVYSETRLGPDLDLVVLERVADGWRPRELRRTPHHEYLGSYSPNGRWLAFASDATGHFEVYLQSSTVRGEPMRVSRGGGTDPFWSADGRTLFFLNRGRLMRLPFGASGLPRPLEPEPIGGAEGVLRARALPDGGFLAGWSTPDPRRQSRAPR